MSKDGKPQGKKENNAGPSENNDTAEGKLPPSRVGELNDRDGRGRWGRLPRTIIEQVYDNGNRRLPDKYRVHLEEYFRRLPEPKK